MKLLFLLPAATSVLLAASVAMAAEPEDPVHWNVESTAGGAVLVRAIRTASPSPETVNTPGLVTSVVPPSAGYPPATGPTAEPSRPSSVDEPPTPAAATATARKFPSVTSNPMADSVATIAPAPTAKPTSTPDADLAHANVADAPSMPNSIKPAQDLAGAGVTKDRPGLETQSRR